MHVDNHNNLPEAEVAAYVARAEDMIRKGELPADTTRMELWLRGDEVEIRYYRDTDGPGFNRIARITGYLVSDIARWNDSKKAELRDRTKHLSKKDPQP